MQAETVGVIDCRVSCRLLSHRGTVHGRIRTRRLSGDGGRNHSVSSRILRRQAALTTETCSCCSDLGILSSPMDGSDCEGESMSRVATVIVVITVHSFIGFYNSLAACQVQLDGEKRRTRHAVRRKHQ